MSLSMHDVSPDLATRYAALRAEQPRLRAIEAARHLGVSELDLVLLDDRTTRLRPDPQAWLRGLPAVGEAMALTRNPWCVHERHGSWNKPGFHAGGKIGLVVGPDIDLRLFLSGWAHLVHTVVDNARGPLRSFQAFDAHGRAIHKVYATKATDLAAWDALVADLTDADPAPVEVMPAPAAEADRPDSDIDVASFQAGWDALKDTHDFFPLLRNHGLGRLQAMRLAGAERARPVPTAAVGSLLETVARDAVSIMVFVGNEGCIQIHTGPVKTIAWRGDWLNVLDPHFNLHLDTSGIAHAFVVRKPTDDGDVHSLELFAADGTLIAQLFGARKPGIPEDTAWTERVVALA